MAQEEILAADYGESPEDELKTAGNREARNDDGATVEKDNL